MAKETILFWKPLIGNDAFHMNMTFNKNDFRQINCQIGQIFNKYKMSLVKSLVLEIFKDLKSQGQGQGQGPGSQGQGQGQGPGSQGQGQGQGLGSQGQGQGQGPRSQSQKPCIA